MGGRCTTVLAVATALLVLSSAGCSGGGNRATAGSDLTTTPPAPSTPDDSAERAMRGADVTAAFTAGITDGTVPIDIAARAFSATIAGLPGVDAGMEPVDATVSGFAAGWIAPYVDQLEPEQRSVVERALYPAVRRASFGASRPRSVAPDATKLQLLVDEILRYVRPRLGLPTEPPYETYVVDPGAADIAPAAVWSAMRGDTCVVTARDGAFAASGLEQLDLSTDVAMAVVKCELWAQMGGIVPPPWRADGFAAWAGCQYVADIDSAIGPRCSSMWAQYFRTPTRSLLDRGEDAIGFFGQVDDVVAPATSLEHYTWKAGSTGLGLSPPDAYAAIVSPAAERWPFLWASGQLQNRDLGRPWNIADRTAPSTGTTALQVLVNGDTAAEANADPYTVGLWEVRADGVDIVTVEGDGHARVAAVGPQNVTDTPITDEQLHVCTKAGGCSCPGSDIVMPESEVLFLAVAGDAVGSAYGVSGSSLDDYCEEQRKSQDGLDLAEVCAGFPTDAIAAATGISLGEAMTPTGFDPNAIGGQVGCVWIDTPGWSAQIFEGSGTAPPPAEAYAMACRMWAAERVVGGRGWVACVGHAPEGYGYADIQTAHVGILLTTAPIGLDDLTAVVEAIGTAYA